MFEKFQARYQDPHYWTGVITFMGIGGRKPARINAGVAARLRPPLAVPYISPGVLSVLGAGSLTIPPRRACIVPEPGSTRPSQHQKSIDTASGSSARPACFHPDSTALFASQ